MIARALACRAGGAEGAEVFASDESAGVTLAWRGALPGADTLRAWLAPTSLREALAASLAEGSLGAAAFREVARVAQLWLPDARKGAVTPSLLYDVLRRHDPDHVLLRAQRHTLWTSLEGPRAESALRRSRRVAGPCGWATGPSALAVPAMVAMRRDGVADRPRGRAPRRGERALPPRAGGPRRAVTALPDDMALLAPGGVFVRDAQTLVVADLHAGYVDTLRHRGVALPPLDDAALLARIDALLRACDPRRVVVAGDLVHGAAATHRRTGDASPLDALLRRFEDACWR
ncbi:MAG: hypothetical protein U0325_17550 [Polyangiales bacterium]